MEVIVVDGNSSDKTVDIIKKCLENSDVKYQIFSENKGLGYARQIVVDNACGRYILWVDGDTVLSKDYVKKQVAFMDAHPKIAITEGIFLKFNGKNLIETLENIEWSINCLDKKFFLESKGVVMRPCCGGSMHRVEALKQVGGFDVEIKGAGEDEDIAFRLLRAGWKIHFCGNAKFINMRSQTLRELWKEQFWYGYGAHYLIHKKTKMVGLAPFFFGFTQAIKAYKITRNKISFLLPIHYYFKKFAQTAGFLKAHIEGYGHKLVNQNEDKK